MEEKEVEEKIRQYIVVCFNLERAKKDLEHYKMAGSPHDITSVDFSRVGSGGGGQQDAFRVMVTTNGLINKINQLEYQKALYENVFRQIKKESPTEYRFLELYYFENRHIQDVAVQLGYSYNSKQTIYSIKKSVLKKCDKYGL